MGSPQGRLAPLTVLPSETCAHCAGISWDILTIWHWAANFEFVVVKPTFVNYLNIPNLHWTSYYWLLKTSLRIFLFQNQPRPPCLPDTTETYNNKNPALWHPLHCLTVFLSKYTDTCQLTPNYILPFQWYTSDTDKLMYILTPSNLPVIWHTLTDWLTDYLYLPVKSTLSEEAGILTRGDPLMTLTD